jgi:hypothetical protein
MENLLTSAILGSFYRFFYQNLPVNQCWEWFAAKDSDGYGIFRVNKKDYKAHRISYCVFNNISNTPFDILHECNNPSCVNPHHLKLGDTYNNMQDRKKIGGYDHMFNNTLSAKITQEIANQIRLEYSQNNITQRKLAHKYNLSYAAICLIINHKRW